jgi:protein gp37
VNITPIQWTTFSANPLKYRKADGDVVWACEKCGPGCKNCYAERLSHRYGGVRRAGKWNAATMATLTPFLDEAELRKMLTAKTIGGTSVNGSRVFVGDMTDIFGEWVPDALLDQLFAVFALCDGTRSGGRLVTFQVLTKRADRLQWYLSDPETPYRIHSEVVNRVIKGWRPYKGSCDWHPITPWPSPNVWVGVSVEDQKRADERIPLLLQTPAAVRFISAEPLLGPVDLSRYVANSRTLHVSADVKGMIANRAFDHLTGDNGQTLTRGEAEVALHSLLAKGVKMISSNSAECIGFSDQTGCPGHRKPRLEWIIVGGESGKGARPFNVSWARSIVRQCKSAGVACFVKQLGARVLDRNDAGFDGCSSTSWPEAIEQRDAIEDNPHGFREEWQGADVRVRLVDSHGGDPSEWPEDLRVREMPEVRR